MVERYARQALIQGWDQDRLAKARVVIIGSHVLAGFVGWGLAALGIGELFLLDDRLAGGRTPAFPCLEAFPGQLAIKALESTLSRINPHISVRGIPLRLLYEAHALAIPDCDVIVEATNDPQSKQICLDHGHKAGVPVILASAGEACGEYAVVAGEGEASLDNHLAYRGRPQGAIPSQVIGGLVLEEVRKLLLPLRDYDRPADEVIRYNLAHPRRFGAAGQAASVQAHFADRYRCLIVGAGALGTYVGMGLALSGIGELTIVDPDVVKETNLNRQVLFYDAVGKPKAMELAAKLRKLCPSVETAGVVAPVAEEHFQGVDMVLSCVDSFETRAFVNEMAVRFGISFINGGTGPFSGEVEVYKPGETACLECSIGVNRLAEQEAGRRARCGHLPEASIVISNQIIGGLMAGEARAVLKHEQPLVGTIEYDAFHPSRLGIRSPRPPCRCHRRGKP